MPLITPDAGSHAAYQQAVRTESSIIAKELQALFGQRLVAEMLQMEDPKAIGRWARGEQNPRPQAQQRLRSVYQVVCYLKQHGESDETVRAWFTGMNPYLGDRAPAQRVTEAPEQVLAAARAFLST